MKIEEGVMVMKNGKAWGVEYADGRSNSYGWIAPEYAPIHDPKYCTEVTDVTHRGSHYTEELLTGKLVKVKRKITVETLE